jgi:hypothetical protein
LDPGEAWFVQPSLTPRTQLNFRGSQIAVRYRGRGHDGTETNPPGDRSGGSVAGTDRRPGRRPVAVPPRGDGGAAAGARGQAGRQRGDDRGPAPAAGAHAARGRRGRHALGNLKIAGYVEASYIYNFENPDAQIGTQGTYQFNNEHNTFQLNGVKLELGKPASEPGMAGFQFDLLFGDNAAVLNNGLAAFYDDDSGSLFGDDQFFIQQGYVSYNWEGVVIQLGKFVTTLGFELIDAPYNPHITHSELFFGAIPLFHTGVLASGDIGETGFAWKAGVVNGFNNSKDFNDNKGILATLGWSGENASVTANTFIGDEGLRLSTSDRGSFGEPFDCDLVGTGSALPATGSTPASPNSECFGDTSNRTQIFEILATVEPMEKLSLWFDGVYGEQELDDDVMSALGVLVGDNGLNMRDPRWWAVATGAVWEFNEKTDVAVRYGWFKDQGNFRLGGMPAGKTRYQSVTATLGYQVTENLKGRVEYRHDSVSAKGESDSFFLKHNDSTTSNQDVGIVEFFYMFE